MTKKLTKLQAYNAMTKLFIHSYNDNLNGDIVIILGSMSFVSDKKTFDPAMWAMWEECLTILLQDKNLQNYNHLTILQSFLAVGLFLKNYFGTHNLAIDIQFLQYNIDLAYHKKKIDPILWQNWQKCVAEVLAVKDSRQYLRLNKD